MGRGLGGTQSLRLGALRRVTVRLTARFRQSGHRTARAPQRPAPVGATPHRAALGRCRSSSPSSPTPQPRQRGRHRVRPLQPGTLAAGPRASPCAGRASARGRLRSGLLLGPATGRGDGAHRLRGPRDSAGAGPAAAGVRLRGADAGVASGGRRGLAPLIERPFPGGESHRQVAARGRHQRCVHEPVRSGTVAVVPR